MQIGKRNFPATTYTPDHQKYHSSSIVAVYVVETIGNAPELCSWLKIGLTVKFPNFGTSENNITTQTNIQGCSLLWKGYIIGTKETYKCGNNIKDNMLLDIDGVRYVKKL